MEKLEFKRLLFKVAFCTMACDGHIDSREVDEMKAMDKNTSFFDGVDLSEALSDLVEELGHKGVQVIEGLFATLRGNTLNPIQELLILEVAVRIINSDEKHDDNEIRFLHLLRAKLDLPDEIIFDRFGDVPLLQTSGFAKPIVAGDSEARFAEDIKQSLAVDFKDAVSGIGDGGG
jgi:hypothetical protein